MQHGRDMGDPEGPSESEPVRLAPVLAKRSRPSGYIVDAIQALCAHLGELAARAAYMYILILKVSRHCCSAPQHGKSWNMGLIGRGTVHMAGVPKTVGNGPADHAYEVATSVISRRPCEPGWMVAPNRAASAVSSSSRVRKRFKKTPHGLLRGNLRKHKNPQDFGDFELRNPGNPRKITLFWALLS
jgi:hypothetical protein